MIKTVFWKIRGVRSKRAIHRLKHLIKINHIHFVAIFEPFISDNKIEGYKKFLGFDFCKANRNGQIWCFWKKGFKTTIVANDDQQITIHFSEDSRHDNFYVASVYAKCSPVDRKDLWDSLEQINISITHPWCIGGDFNVITDPTEKLGGKPHRMYKSLDFINCLDNCGATNVGFTGPKFNGATTEDLVREFGKT